MKSKIIFIQTLVALAMTVALAPVVPGVASAAVRAPAQTEHGTQVGRQIAEYGLNAYLQPVNN